MAEKLKVLEQQIAYDAEEIELKDQLAWARVHISEQESAEMARKIATRIEVLILLLQNFLKGILHQKNFYRLNLIFWIVMGCGIARFGRRGLKTTET